MVAERKFPLVTIRAEDGTLTFTRVTDGATAAIGYSLSNTSAVPVTDEDMVLAYSEDEALLYIADANDTEVERYLDESLGELDTRDEEYRASTGGAGVVIAGVVIALIVFIGYVIKGHF